MNNKNLNINSKHQFTESGVKSVLKNTNNFKSKYEIIVKSIAEKYTDEIKILSKELSTISKIKDNSEKEIKFEEFEKNKLKNLENIEYIINLDTELVKDVKIINALRHYYYELNNNILSIKNEIMVNKLNDYEEKIERIDSLESKFENLGATVISIILSISLISAAITAIEKLDISQVIVFLVCLVWFGMTFLLFIHDLFSAKKKQGKTAIIMYFIITITMIAVVGYSCKDALIGQLNPLINS